MSITVVVVRPPDTETLITVPCSKQVTLKLLNIQLAAIVSEQKESRLLQCQGLLDQLEKTQTAVTKGSKLTKRS